MLERTKTMPHHIFALLLPLIVIPFVAIGVVAIGSALLAVGDFWAVPLALVFTFAVIFGAMYLENRGAKRQTQGSGR